MLWSMEKFFAQSVKNYLRTYDNTGKITTDQADDSRTDCLLDYPYFREHFKIIIVNLSKKQVLYADPIHQDSKLILLEV